MSDTKTSKVAEFFPIAFTFLAERSFGELKSEAMRRMMEAEREVDEAEKALLAAQSLVRNKRQRLRLAMIEAVNDWTQQLRGAKVAASVEG